VDPLKEAQPPRPKDTVEQLVRSHTNLLLEARRDSEESEKVLEWEEEMEIEEPDEGEEEEAG